MTKWHDYTAKWQERNNIDCLIEYKRLALLIEQHRNTPAYDETLEYLSLIESEVLRRMGFYPPRRWMNDAPVLVDLKE